ncbi:MAG: sigma-E factor negative regulatory protein [Proteobacteria bacterium]|nr:sigma-E factor negative regulatory protein [Pseudomonadota bacterium]MDA0982488.1 sigma-E factor negative regulatory protein [Pseudomonadota bacterium]
MTTQKISELADGELDGHDAAAAYSALKSGGEPLEAWRRYHLISDAMRDTRLLSDGFAQRVAARLAEEPTVLAPKALIAPARSLPWYATRVAAGIAAVSFVGFATMSMLDQGGTHRVAQTPKAAAPAVAIVAPAAVPTSESALDYMQAHQGYSPRNSLQGHVDTRQVQTVSGRIARQP